MTSIENYSIQNTRNTQSTEHATVEIISPIIERNRNIYKSFCMSITFYKRLLMFYITTSLFSFGIYLVTFAFDNTISTCNNGNFYTNFSSLIFVIFLFLLFSRVSSAGIYIMSLSSLNTNIKPNFDTETNEFILTLFNSENNRKYEPYWCIILSIFHCVLLISYVIVFNYYCSIQPYIISYNIDMVLQLINLCYILDMSCKVVGKLSKLNERL